MKKFNYIAAATLKQAESLLSKVSKARKGKSVKIIAGGTDLLGVLKDNIHPESPDTIIDLKSIQGLNYIQDDRKSLRIGALTTLQEIAANKTIQENFNLLALAARSVASPQIRNMGTIGGNICQEPRCWYYRAPDNLFYCLRKGGTKCSAVLGENRYHSIFGGIRAGSPSCTDTCPGHVKISTYMSEMRAGKIRKAANTILSNNPMPALTGRICPHYCESACNRRNFDESVSVRSVERFLGDYILDHAAGLMKAPEKKSAKKVAIVGSGPAGLSAAYYLRIQGYNVTVFDKMPEAGGMLTYCIPGYRLSNDVVRKQIKAYEKMGIQFILNTNIGEKGKTLRDLRKKFNSVFLATGTWQQKDLKLDKSDLLTSGMDFLTRIEQYKKQSPGNKVLVIGGGNVAVDVAISALRIGAKEVTMVCLEDRESMPAFPEEIRQAVQEGVKIMNSLGPFKILECKGQLTGMEFTRCTQVFDEHGCFHPCFDLSKKEIVQADRIIVAIGQSAELAYAGKLIKTDRGLITVHPETGATNISGVFAGGDVTSGPSSVITAVASGRKAAISIDAFLSGDKNKESSIEKQARKHEFLDTHIHSYDRSERVEALCVQSSCKGLDAEDHSTLHKQAVESEIQRCLNCGCVAVNASDLAPALIALDAIIITTKKAVNAEDFFSIEKILDSDEIVTEIKIPVQKQKGVQNYLKFRIRNAIDFPIVSLASVLNSNKGQFANTKIVLGAVAPVPLRMHAVEKYLNGKEATEAVAEEAGEIAVRNVKPLSKNRYKIQIMKALIKKTVLEINE
ncbi:MAG: pyridine nucleotide-disulfide oxidoreductase [Desulfobacterium sp.]|nr:pyridine nucleotide-disulfide oxidoreductase [Desulfobacterium sp.]